MSTPVETRSIELLRRENAELAASLDEEKRINRGYRDLLAAAAHEMRTPLHAIGLHLEMIARLSHTRTASEQRDQIARARRVLDGYVRRTSMLLDAARVSSGVFTLKTEPVALAELFASVSELYAAKAESQHAGMKVEVEPGIVGQWDRAAVETIVANLVSNALKYGQGAPIVISGESDDAGNAVIRVADSGPGIAADQRSRIFEKFNRSVPNRTFAGFGLGLWIARHLALLHGGSLILEPTSAGSTFVVTLPVRQAQTAGSPG